MIVLCNPKGWTGPKLVDGKQVEVSWRSHQVPIAEFKTGGRVQQLEGWLKSYRPEELFDEDGLFREDWAMLAPTGQGRMGCNPHANGGALLKPRDMPSFRVYAVAMLELGVVEAEATRVLGRFLRDVMRLNLKAANFRLVGPDETASNRLDAVFEVSDKVWLDGVQGSVATTSALTAA